ncbi:sodium calcium exchanger [Micractinium conductrix]|uniref:Sodium calcium exchanger n=1 Tax=Micractinium conductrix TaxID=554055 RepID=A0A2P6V8R3_9CHLO|nr:sodium calcium exchanger [Micractinium conductrix]|eukprot:PSC70482.1 sodium calcium exchanger [Micractinium conductrix]
MPGRRPAVLALVLSLAALLAGQVACQDALEGKHHHHKHQHHGEPNPSEELECGDIRALPKGADRCTFVREHCTDRASLLNYPTLFYCGAQPHGPVLAGLMVLGCLALLALLFRIIARAADDFFSCILSQISQDLGLPPRLGGVTLLALGNGAPDLSASIEAVKSGDYQLAMGALTGAGMFVGAVVAGRIVTLNGGVRARPAQIRDIATQFLTVAVVTGIVASGSFTYASVATLLSIYGAYVVVVAVADFTKRAGVEWGDVVRNVSKRMSKRFRVEMVAPLLQEDYGAGAAGTAGTAAAPAAPSRATPGALTRILPIRGGGGGGGGLLGSAGSLPGSGGGTAGRLAPTPEEGALLEASGDAAGAPLAALGGAASLPPDLEAAQLEGPSPPWLPPGAAGSRFASLPDLHTGGRRHEAEVQHAQHPRHAPPLAHFQPHISYGDLVHMSAKEYRQRALAEMAQSKSFFARNGGRVAEEDRSDSDSEYYSGDEGADWGEAGAPPRDSPQRRSPERDYRPPVVRLNATLLAAQQAVAEVEAAAAAAGAAPAAVPPLPARSPPYLSPTHLTPHQSSGSRSGSTMQFSVASFEVAPPAPAEGGRMPGAGGPEAEAEPVLRAGAFWVALEATQRPLLLLLQSTIPLVESNSYQRPWFLRAMAASPLFITFYLRLVAWPSVAAALAAGALLAAAGHLGTRSLGGKAPEWTLGTQYPIGAALVAVYGFGVAAIWISLFATEIVGLLQFLGMVCKAEPAVLGVTVLAWGNSLMDYMNNTAMAGRSRGGNSMAMTACFAGPLFNMLVGLGIGFWSLLQESHLRRAAVTMDPVVLVGCLFIMLNCVCLIVVSLAHRHWLPAWCGWAMVGGYCAYLASVLGVLVIVGDSNAVGH